MEPRLPVPALPDICAAMKVAIVVADGRENYRNYDETTPRFPSGSASLFDGFARLPGVELHLISCLQRRVTSPEKLAVNIWYHALHVDRKSTRLNSSH